MLSNAHRISMLNAFKTIARQVAADGVTLDTVLPGRIDTDRLAELLGSREAAVAAAEQEVPAGRLGTVEEFAAIAVLLCSARASYVTGETVAVDGGLLRSVFEARGRATKYPQGESNSRYAVEGRRADHYTMGGGPTPQLDARPVQPGCEHLFVKPIEREQARRMRRDEGRSIREIAARLGVSPSSVSRWVSTSPWRQASSRPCASAIRPSMVG